MASGDTLYVKNGTYNESFTIRGPDGTVSAPTKILNFPGHTPILRGGGIGSGRMKIADTVYLDFEGFETTNHQHGLYVDDDCGPVFGCPASNINIRRVTAHDVGGECFAARGNVHDIVFEGVTAYNCGLSGSENGEGIYVGGANASDSTHHITIRNSTVHHTKDEGIELKHDSHDIMVEGNLVYEALNPGSSFSNTGGAIETNPSQGAFAGNPNIVIRNNTIRDIHLVNNSSGYAIQLDVGATVYNNILYNIGSPYPGINSSGSDGFARLIYHNTIDVPSARALTSSGTTPTVSNNIGPSSTNNSTVNSAFFVNYVGHDYHLVSGATVVNAGVDLRATVPVDKDGVTRDATPDRGAYEYANGDNVPPVAPTNLRVQ
jgi:hypothetical protein